VLGISYRRVAPVDFVDFLGCGGCSQPVSRSDKRCHLEVSDAMLSGRLCHRPPVLRTPVASNRCRPVDGYPSV